VLASETRRSTGRALYDAVVTGGAQALGVRSGLAVGAPADILVIDPDHHLLAGRTEDSWIDTLLFGGARSVIAEVWAGGVRQVEGGRHRHRDRIERAYAHAIRGLLGSPTRRVRQEQGDRR
jgi:cytosine/adenosine deaminase-related metal-dependent hydrolase